MNILIIGASGGIGSAFVQTLAARGSVQRVVATYRSTQPAWEDAKVDWVSLDVTDESDVARLAQEMGEIDWLINAAGLLHEGTHGPEKRVAQVDPEFVMQNFRVNTLPTLLLAKHMTPLMRHGRPALFATVSARLGSIGENALGGWYSYRASKAALNMVIRNLAIEMRRTHPQLTLASVHPGTTDTSLSRPFQRNVPADALFTPAYSVNCMLQVLEGLTPEDSGGFWSFDGEALPW
ncbi:SDR family NAD(P)-dependent oxidoreductase [Ectothiorhodospira marina]|jgi:NAD(P)-dependent dehydrogenase (short-subunit alcohol dehydrogenase family)|uniref:NAD(P)-dependent dehydrogenase, short-chain alcohol dehydrogenase family n=1 Tax=Ectothiorhodospira marina TaxID=1396821 RepID=A0A1H7MRC8_9GAMM|nr:SDR family NAD(P)-dependent oxidoreductase [Ectothiorhodospira marina]SEL13388.1 NAD(P)-dependent dehydrogenase, short-chain alcohol dehydrogenase family [Ectothiorhodospira marina]